MIEAVDREKRITIIKIAVPKKACTTLAAETAGASKKLVLRTYCWEVIRTILDATNTKDNRRQGAMRTLVCSCDLPLGSSSSSTRETGRHPFRLLVLSDWRPEPCFGTYFQHLSLEASTTGCLPQRREWMDRKFFFDEKIGVLPHEVFQKKREETYTRDKILTQVWTSHVKDVFDVTHLIQTKA